MNPWHTLDLLTMDRQFGNVTSPLRISEVSGHKTETDQVLAMKKKLQPLNLTDPAPESVIVVHGELVAEPRVPFAV